MESQALLKILTTHAKCKKDGVKHLVPEGTAVTMFAAAGSAALVIDRVQEVTLEGDVVVARTSRHDIYALLAQDVQAIKVTEDKAQAGYR